MQISKENKSHQLSLVIDRLYRTGRSLDELNECLWTGGSGKQKFPPPSLLSFELLVSINENTDRKRKKEKKEREKKDG